MQFYKVTCLQGSGLEGIELARALTQMAHAGTQRAGTSGADSAESSSEAGAELSSDAVSSEQAFKIFEEGDAEHNSQAEAATLDECSQLNQPARRCADHSASSQDGHYAHLPVAEQMPNRSSELQAPADTASAADVPSLRSSTGTHGGSAAGQLAAHAHAQQDSDATGSQHGDAQRLQPAARRRISRGAVLQSGDASDADEPRDLLQMLYASYAPIAAASGQASDSAAHNSDGSGPSIMLQMQAGDTAHSASTVAITSDSVAADASNSANATGSSYTEPRGEQAATQRSAGPPIAQGADAVPPVAQGAATHQANTDQGTNQAALADERSAASLASQAAGSFVPSTAASARSVSFAQRAGAEPAHAGLQEGRGTSPHAGAAAELAPERPSLSGVDEWGVPRLATPRLWVRATADDAMIYHHNRGISLADSSPQAQQCAGEHRRPKSCSSIPQHTAQRDGAERQPGRHDRSPCMDEPQSVQQQLAHALAARSRAAPETHARHLTANGAHKLWPYAQMLHSYQSLIWLTAASCVRCACAADTCSLCQCCKMPELTNCRHFLLAVQRLSQACGHILLPVVSLQEGTRCKLHSPAAVHPAGQPLHQTPPAAPRQPQTPCRDPQSRLLRRHRLVLAGLVSDHISNPLVCQ